MKALLRVFQAVLLLLLAGGALLLRCHNRADTFIDGHIYFIDADCYSRMTRVRMIAENPGTVVRDHGFENYPQGVDSHATAPLDYLIVGTKWVLDGAFAQGSWARWSVLAGQTADLAGALVSPLLGAATALFLALWGWRVTAHLGLPGRGLRVVAAAAPALAFTVSPIAVAATVLGRPDHQSLLLFLLAVALGAEGILAGEGTLGTHRLRWAVGAGLAWGMALWVSFYEPLVLLGAVIVLLVVFERRRLLAPERRYQLACLAGVVLVSRLVEGWHFGGLSPEALRYFPQWSRTIGELKSLSPFDPNFRHWLGWGFYLTPFLLIGASQTVDRRAWPWLAIFCVTLGLACWQIRWASFLALVFAMTLPWQIAALRRCWIAAPVLVAGLFGTAHAWEITVFPEGRAADAVFAKRRENVLLREIAARIEGPFLAPWWESPALAYWSRQPGVAGSSHESLPGIVDSARFFLDVHDRAAAEILRRRQVAFVVSDDATRLLSPEAGLLAFADGPDPIAPSERLVARLNENPFTAEPYLKPVYTNLFFKLFAVDHAKLQP